MSHDLINVSWVSFFVNDDHLSGPTSLMINVSESLPFPFRRVTKLGHFDNFIIYILLEINFKKKFKIKIDLAYIKY